MPAVCNKGFFAFIVLLAMVSSAAAQPLISHSESLESMAVNSDVLLVAKIVKLLGEPPASDGEARQVQLDIEEILRQSPYHDDPYLEIHVDLPYRAAMLTDWQQRSSRLLVAYDGDNPQSTRVIELETGKSDVLLADFTRLREPDDVIQAARQIVRRLPAGVKRLHTFNLNVPRERILGTRWEQYHGHMLSVPVDDRLECRAICAISSDLYQQREEAVRALRYFRSDANIARLRKLLNDPGWSYLYHAQENNVVEVRIYGVRREAYLTLKSWGVAVKEPMIREEVRQP